MKIEKNRFYEDLSLILLRTKRTFFAVAGLFLLLLFFFWKVQVLDFKKFWSLSEANRTRESVISAPRGLITDRNDIILADNAGSFKASLIRENCPDFGRSIKNISRLLQIAEADLEARIGKYASFPLFKPIIVKDNLDLREVSRIESQKLEFPELVVEADPRRFYPFSNLAAHVIGYMQELTPEEMKFDSYKGRNLGDLVGRTGVENEFESLLIGTDGRLTEVVDSVGRSQGEVARVDPLPGHNLQLTLDFDLQRKATQLLEGREGAIVVLDPRTGEVLALASFPTYDPNKFIARFTPQEWMSLINRPDDPLENRAIRGLYAPGSVFKPAIALGALSSGLITEQTTFFCGGTTRFYGRPFSCWFAGGHGVQNLPQAIQHSCNIYFYNAGRRLGAERIAEYAKTLGLGSLTGIDLPGEKEGLVPTEEWSRNVRKTGLFPGETISLSIGQGPLLVTPLQVACYTAILANRGGKVVPHLLRSPSEALKQTVQRPNSSGRTISVETFETVIKGMWKSVNEGGTGHSAMVDKFDVCGKTGSTQLISKERAAKLGKQIKTHSWFTGFAPRDNPQAVVTILVEYGGMGGATAAPLAKELFTLYKEKYD